MPNRSVLGEMSLSANSLAPGALPDFQQGINAQLKFFSDLQQMYLREQANARANAAAARAAASIGADGLNAYQRAYPQLQREKLEDQRKKAQGTDKSPEVIGTDPITGESITATVNGKAGSTERKEEIRRQLETYGRQKISADDELNRYKAMLGDTTNMSDKRQKELLKKASDRTRVLANAYGVDPASAFALTFGSFQQKEKELAKQLDDASSFDALIAGASQGWNSLKAGFQQLLASPEESQRIAEENIKRNQEIAMNNPTLRETELRRQEAAAEGKDLGWFDATEGNRWNNLAATVGNLGATLGPGVALGMGATVLGPVAGTAAAVGATGLLGGALGMEGYNERVASTEGLTDQQKQEAISLSNPAAAANAGINAFAGALMPGGVGNALVRTAGRVAAPSLSPVIRGVAARTVAAPTASEISGMVADAGLGATRSRLAQAGLNAAVRQAAPRTAGRLFTDVAANSLENAGIMAGSTMLSNAAYNAGANQNTPITQGVAESAIEGALIGVPFGGLRWMHRGRPQAAAPVPPRAGVTAPQDTTPSATPPGEGMVNAFAGSKSQATDRRDDAAFDGIHLQYMEPTPEEAQSIINRSVRGELSPQDAPSDLLTQDDIKTLSGSKDFAKWFGELRKAAENNDDGTVDMLLADYVRNGGRLEDVEYLLLSRSQSDTVADENLASYLPFVPEARKDGRLLNKTIKLKEPAAQSIAAAIENFRRMPEQERSAYVQRIIPANTQRSGLAAVLGKLERNREGRTPQGSTANDSAVATDTAEGAGSAPRGDIVQADNSIVATQEERPAGTPDAGAGTDQVPPASPVPQGRSQTAEPNRGTDTASARPGREQASESAGKPADTSVRTDGESRNGEAVSRSEQSAGQPVNESFTNENGSWVYRITQDGVSHELTYYPDGDMDYMINGERSAVLPNEALGNLSSSKIDEAVSAGELDETVANAMKESFRNADSYDLAVAPVTPAASTKQEPAASFRAVAENTPLNDLMVMHDNEVEFIVDYAKGEDIVSSRLFVNKDTGALRQVDNGKAVPLNISREQLDIYYNALANREALTEDPYELDRINQIRTLYHYLAKLLPTSDELLAQNKGKKAEKKKLGKAVVKTGVKKTDEKAAEAPPAETQAEQPAGSQQAGESFFERPTESRRIYYGKATNSGSRRVEVFDDGTIMTPTAEDRFSANPESFFVYTLDADGNGVIFRINGKNEVLPLTGTDLKQAGQALYEAFAERKIPKSAMSEEKSDAIRQALEEDDFSSLESAMPWRWMDDEHRVRKSFFSGEEPANSAIETVARQSGILTSLLNGKGTEKGIRALASSLAKHFPNLRIGRDKNAVTVSRMDADAEGYGEYDPITQAIRLNSAISSPVSTVHVMFGEVAHALSDEYLSINAKQGFFNDLYYEAQSERPDFIETYKAGYGLSDTPGIRERALLGEEAFAHLRMAHLDLINVPVSSWTADIANTIALLHGDSAAFDGLGYMLSRASRMDAVTAREYIPSVITQAIISDPSFNSAFLKTPLWKELPQDTSPLVTYLSRDYKELMLDNSLPVNEETLRTYLRAVLDPDTVMDVFKTGSRIC